jgi:signal transduction histidine kinase
VRLSQFILGNLEKILVEFEAFARSIVPADSMDIAALRDHAKDMLTVIAHDLETLQTSSEAIDKSKGDLDSTQGGLGTPAERHGLDRSQSGFTVSQMVSEYRALRASVIRLWIKASGELKGPDLEDVIRFNEAIDQALAESTTRFMKDLDATKERFLGILGHDLRTPLGAIITAGKFMREMGGLAPTVDKLAATIVSSGERMNAMVDDLLDFTRSQLGHSFPIVRQPVDLEKLLHTSVEEVKAAHPKMMLKLETSGDLRGEWDQARLSQVLSNLLSNAISHGSAGTPVTVKARGEGSRVIITVHNSGQPIPEDQLEQIFLPLSRSSSKSANADHLGLGLYIADQIVSAHSGTIGVESSPTDGTTFTVCLPRHAD